MAIEQKLPDEHKAAYEAFQRAVTALDECWDALREMELELGFEIETDDIQEMAGGDDTSVEAFLQLLENLKEAQ